MLSIAPGTLSLARLGLLVSNLFFGHLLCFPWLECESALLAKPTILVAFIDPNKQVPVPSPARVAIGAWEETRTLVQSIWSMPFGALHASFPVLAFGVVLAHALHCILPDILVKSCPLLRRGLRPSLLVCDMAGALGALSRPHRIPLGKRGHELLLARTPCTSQLLACVHHGADKFLSCLLDPLRADRAVFTHSDEKALFDSQLH